MKFCSNCGAEGMNGTYCHACGCYTDTINYRAWPRSTMFEAYQSMWQNYANFSGRARRSDYWFAMLTNALINVFLSIIMKLFNTPIITIISLLYALAIFIPGLALAARRLHDTGKSGHLLWLILIPVINLGVIVAMLFFYSQDSQKESNRFGESPKYYLN